jgi:hypothetical protein
MISAQGVRIAFRSRAAGIKVDTGPTRFVYVRMLRLGIAAAWETVPIPQAHHRQTPYSRNISAVARNPIPKHEAIE